MEKLIIKLIFLIALLLSASSLSSPHEISADTNGTDHCPLPCFMYLGFCCCSITADQGLSSSSYKTTCPRFGDCPMTCSCVEGKCICPITVYRGLKEQVPGETYLRQEPIRTEIRMCRTDKDCMVECKAAGFRVGSCSERECTCQN